MYRGPQVSEENPLVGYRERFVRDWPGSALRAEGDELFPEGWRQAALTAAAEGRAIPEMVDSLPQGERRAYHAESEQLRTLALHLVERDRERPPPASRPHTVSVGGLVEYERCPKKFYWSSVQPLPRFSGPAARLGTQVHAWIERQSSGQASLLTLDEAPDLTAEDLIGEPGKVERLRRTFQDSRFAAAPPLYAERPFLLYLGGFVVSGRIDAIFGMPDGPWEVVDYKTGRRPAENDRHWGLQLDLYGLACTEVWGKRAEDLTLTYFYLADGGEVSRPAGDPDETRKRVAEALRRIAGAQFDPTPGEQCRWCDFLSFCQAGQAFVESPPSGRGGI